MLYRDINTYAITQVREVEIDEALARKVNWRLGRWIAGKDIPVVTVEDLEELITEVKYPWDYESVEVFNAHLPEYFGESESGTSWHRLNVVLNAIFCEIVDALEPVEEIVGEWIDGSEEIEQ